MTLKKRLTTIFPAGKKRKRLMIICLLSICLLLCGFSWIWAIEFAASVIFPFEDAVDSRLILHFSDVVNLTDLQTYLTEPLIAEQVIDGVQSNLSGDVYSNIELPDMRAEGLSRKIIRTIFDRLFT